MNGMWPKKEHTFKINVGSLLLLLSMESLVNGMYLRAMPGYSKTGDAPSHLTDTTKSSIEYGYLGNNPQQQSKYAQMLSKNNKVIERNLEASKGNAKEELHQDTQGIRRILYYENSMSAPPMQSTGYGPAPAPAPGQGTVLIQEHPSNKDTFLWIGFMFFCVIGYAVLRALDSKK